MRLLDEQLLNVEDNIALFGDKGFRERPAA